MHEIVPFTGQSAGLVREVLPVAEIVRALLSEAEQALDSVVGPARGLRRAYRGGQGHAPQGVAGLRGGEEEEEEVGFRALQASTSRNSDRYRTVPLARSSAPRPSSTAMKWSSTPYSLPRPYSLARTKPNRE